MLEGRVPVPVPEGVPDGTGERMQDFKQLLHLLPIPLHVEEEEHRIYVFLPTGCQTEWLWQAVEEEQVEDLMLYSILPGLREGVVVVQMEVVVQVSMLLKVEWYEVPGRDVQMEVVMQVSMLLEEGVELHLQEVLEALHGVVLVGRPVPMVL
jgi:hypothetical protein